MSKRILALLISFIIGFAVITPATVSAYYNDTQATEITQEQPAPPHYENGESAEVPEETPTTGNETPETPATDYEPAPTEPPATDPSDEQAEETPAPPTTTPPTDETDEDEEDEDTELSDGDEDDETLELDETETDELDEETETDETDENEELEEPETEDETETTESERFTITISPTDVEARPGTSVQFTYTFFENLTNNDNANETETTTPLDTDSEETAEEPENSEESNEPTLSAEQAGETETTDLSAEQAEETGETGETPTLDHSISWSIIGESAEGTTINENGLLIISPTQPLGRLTIRATATINSTVVAETTTNVQVIMGIAPVLVDAWDFNSPQSTARVTADINNLPAITFNITLDDTANEVAQATVQWFARASGAAHLTGVPVGLPSAIDLAAARSTNGFNATLQLVDEWGIIPRLPNVPLTPAMDFQHAAETPYISEMWEYFVEVTFTTTANVEDSTRSVTGQNNESVEVEVDFNGPGFVRNRAPRDYFPNIHDPDLLDRMPMTPYLNDPFIFFESFMTNSPQLGTNGRVVTEDDWWQRNEEIRDLLGYYWFGLLPEIPIENITVNSPTTLNLGAANPINITVRSNGRVWTGDIGNITMPSQEQIDNSPFNLANGIPIVLGGTHALALQNGIATATVAGSGLSVNPPGGFPAPNTGTGMHYVLHPKNRNITEFNIGNIMANASQSSRLLDAIDLMPEWGVDSGKSATIGVSIGGKIAMMRGVIDERVALTIPVESGAFGMTHFRNLVEGKVTTHHVNSLNPVFVRAQKPMNSWFFTGEAFWFANGAIHTGFANRVDPEDSIYRIPFDMHLVAALAAPRGLLAFDQDGSGGPDGWMNPFGQKLVIEAAREVYAFLGVPENIGGRVRDQNHAVQARDWPFVVATLRSMFGTSNATGRNIGPVGPITVVEPPMAMTPPAYDFGTFSSINDLSATPYELQSRFIQWARPGVNAIWTNQEYITEGLPFSITAYTTAPSGTNIELIHWNHGDRNRAWNVAPTRINSWTAASVNGRVTFNLSGDEVGVGRYELRIVGDNTHRPIFFTGLDQHTALRTGVSAGTSHMYRSYGFTSRVDIDRLTAYTADNQGVRTYLPSVPQEEAIQLPGTNFWGGWIMEYGFGLPEQGAAGTANNRMPAGGSLILTNVQLEAMPGFTFEVSFGQGLLTPSSSFQTSEAVQAAGAFPHWPPPGGLDGRATGASTPSPGGENGPMGALPDGSRPFAPLETTDFASELTFDLVRGGNSLLNGIIELQAGDQLTIDFSLPVNTRDFGIGFDFSDDFTLAWDGNDVNESERLVVTFHSFTQNAGMGNVYIMRMRQSSPANTVINAPVHWSFDMQDQPELLEITQVSEPREVYLDKSAYFSVTAQDIADETFNISIRGDYGIYLVDPDITFEDGRGYFILGITDDIGTGEFDLVLSIYGARRIDGVTLNQAFVLEVEQVLPANPLPAPTNLVITVETATLTWNAVAGAVGYAIYVDGVRVYTVMTNSHDLLALNLPYGTHVLQIRALGDDVNYSDSPLSYTINFIVTEYGIVAPLPAPTNLVITGTTLTWNAVANSIYYAVYVDGSRVATDISATSFNLATLNLAIGTHSVQVRAVGDHVAFTSSALSLPIYFTLTADGIVLPLPAPTNLVITGTTLTWNTVANAIYYAVYVDNSRVATDISVTSFNLATLNLPVGTHPVQVRAIGDNVAYTDSPLSVAVNFTVTDETAPPPPGPGQPAPPPPPPVIIPPAAPPTVQPGETAPTWRPRASTRSLRENRLAAQAAQDPQETPAIQEDDVIHTAIEVLGAEDLQDINIPGLLLMFETAIYLNDESVDLIDGTTLVSINIADLQLTPEQLALLVATLIFTDGDNVNFITISGTVDGDYFRFLASESGLYGLMLLYGTEEPSAIAPPPTPEQPPTPVIQPTPAVQASEVRLQIGSVEYTVDGVTMVSEVAPFIDAAYNRTMVPLRLISEALGATVTWTEETRTVTITQNGVVIPLQLDTPLPDGMGVPTLLDGRTFVPAAYVGQMLGATITWDAETQAVYITP